MEEEVERARKILEDFLTDVATKLNVHELEDLLVGDKTLEGKEIGYKPETYTEEHMIWKLLAAVGLEVGKRPWGGIGWPDFDLKNVSAIVVGENKPINKFAEAVSDIKKYLLNRAISPDYGIATDGVNWALFKVEIGGDFVEFPLVEEVDLRPALQQLARDLGLLSQRTLPEVDVGAILRDFVAVFQHDSFNELLTKAPHEIQDKRKKSVEDFYDLYVELLFGKGKKHDYETTLISDVKAPPDATEIEKKVFCITLVNRLLFVKFLEEKGVLETGFLHSLWERYRDSRDELAGDFYATQIKPLFYDLLNSPIEERSPKHRMGWFDKIPYLNGGLFRENVRRETEYEVSDRVLPLIVEDLIEGHKLEMGGDGLDPSILGSVFEKTINYIGGEEGRQKAIGAYYTPKDVARLITSQTVDKRIKEIIAEVYAEVLSRDDEEAKIIHSWILQGSLDKVLLGIEQREGWFGNPEALKTTLDRIASLKVLDPACGSGHFLTTAMEEIYRVQLSLMRALSAGDDPDPVEVFNRKRDLALNSIYGVDVDPVGVEIAKLRIWLKIVEDGWESGFGELPNIDVNIVAGNSLVGFPLTGAVQSTIDVWDERAGDLAELRNRYKFNGDDTKGQISTLLQEVRKQLDTEFLKHMNHKVASTVECQEALDDLFQSILTDDATTLHPYIESVQVKRRDGEGLSDQEKEMFLDFGFNCYAKTARLNVKRREKQLRSNGSSGREAIKRIWEELQSLLVDQEYILAKVTRRPSRFDLDGVLGRPFHWSAEFPEVANPDGHQHSVGFDIIVGNPPYGDILNDSDKALVATYESANIAEVAANFVERQLQLLKKDGYFGNVTTLGLVYQSNLAKFHDLLRDQLSTVFVTCFAHRPRQVFENAIVRVAVITGKKKDVPRRGEIWTSGFLQFDDESRDRVFSNVTYKPADSLLLRERIGGHDRTYEILPKIGSSMIEGILSKFQNRSNRIVGDAVVREETEFVVYRRRGGGYWLNAVVRNIHKSASEIEPLYFDNDLERQLVFLIINSSTFYIYWITYGDFRHLNTGHITRFPLPERDELDMHRDVILRLAKKLWSSLREAYVGSIRNQFDMPRVKPIVDEVDDFLGELYGLSGEEVEYVKKYNSEFARRAHQE